MYWPTMFCSLFRMRAPGGGVEKGSIEDALWLSSPTDGERVDEGVPAYVSLDFGALVKRRGARVAHIPGVARSRLPCLPVPSFHPPLWHSNP